jgi:hypothetical protein
MAVLRVYRRNPTIMDLADLVEEISRLGLVFKFADCLPEIPHSLIMIDSKYMVFHYSSRISNLFILSECEMFHMVTYWTCLVLHALLVENESVISANPYIFYHANMRLFSRTH